MKGLLNGIRGWQGSIKGDVVVLKDDGYVFKGDKKALKMTGNR